MRETTYESADGRKWVVLLPLEAPESQASMGAIVGPPDLSPLGLPDEVAVRLHNELFNRKLITVNDLRHRMPELTAALQLAFRADAQALHALYASD